MTSPDRNARHTFRCLYGVDAPAGAIVIGLGGEVLRILDDGGAEDVGPTVPNRRGFMVDLPRYLARTA